MLSQFQAYPFSLGIFLAFCSYSGHFSLTKASFGWEIFHCLINLTPLRVPSKLVLMYALCICCFNRHVPDSVRIILAF